MRMRFLGLLAAGLVLWGGDSGITISVANRSEHHIADASLQFSGGEVKIGSLSMNERKTVKLIPVVDSDITLETREVAKTVRRRALQVYITSGVRGTVDVEIRRDHSLQVKSALDVGL